MNARPADRLAIAVAQLNPTVGDIAGNAEKGAPRARTAAARGADLVVFPELFIAGYPPEDLVLKPALPGGLPRRGRGAGARNRRRRSGAADRHAVGRGRQALQRRGAARRRPRSRRCASRSICRTTACSTKSACSRRARCRGRSISAACASAFRSARISGATGDSVECLAETGGEILLVPNGSPYWRGKDDERLNVAVARVTEARPAARSMSIRSAARTSWCSTAPRSASMPTARSRSSLPAFREAVAPRVGTRTADGWRCDDGPMAAAGDGDEADYAACVLGLRDYVEQERFPGRRARPFGRHRFGAVRGDRGRCAGRRARALRDAALPFHRAGIARRRGGHAPRRSACTTTSCRSRRAVEGLEAALAPTLRRHCRATSPRKTCRRARAAPS